MAGTVDLIAQAMSAPTWNDRVGVIRRVPEVYGTSWHQAVYADIAQRVYVPNLTPEFGYVHWRDDYELEPFTNAYRAAEEATRSFQSVEKDDLARVIREHPTTLRVFRVMLGLTPPEFAEATGMVGATAVGKATVGTIETGGTPTTSQADACAAVVDQGMRGLLFPAAPGAPRSKLQKPDTVLGWESVRSFARHGVPLAVLLHQRHYGGAFRQILDATSTLRGDLLEDPVEELLRRTGIPYVRTGAHNQSDIERRFGLTVRPAPDFVIFDDRSDGLRGLIECKGANDGGTARDKAARFRTLRVEANRLGGVPLFAVLGGIGWRRTNDALGPVVRDTDGRVFTLATLPHILDVEPLPDLVGRITGP